MAKENARRTVSRRTFVKGAGALGLAVGAAGMCSAEDWLRPAQALADETPAETTAFTYHNEHCLCNCMLECTVRDGRLVMVQPRTNEDKRFQNICLKGIAEIQNIYGESAAAGNSRLLAGMRHSR